MSDGMRSIRWRSTSDGGLEHCVMKIGAAGITAEGVIIAGAGEEGYGLRYRIVVDAEWASLRSVHVTRLGGATVALRHDGYGEWTDGEGKKRADLSKCLDLTLAGSPFTLTATIRRMAWKAGKSVELPMLTIAAPALDVTRTTVKITAVEPGRRYRVATEGSPDHEIEVDGEGFVTRVGDAIVRAKAEPARVGEAVA